MSALRLLAQGSAESNEEDEWEYLAKMFANSLRSIKSVEQQRRAKFTIQSAIFQISVPQQVSYSHASFNQMPAFSIISQTGFINNSGDEYEGGYYTFLLIQVL